MVKIAHRPGESAFSALSTIAQTQFSSVCSVSYMDHKKDWRVIAEQPSKEMDTEKLLILADRLCEAFDEEQTPVANLQTVNWMISSSGTSAIQPAEDE